MWEEQKGKDCLGRYSRACASVSFARMVLRLSLWSRVGVALSNWLCSSLQRDVASLHHFVSYTPKDLLPDFCLQRSSIVGEGAGEHIEISLHGDKRRSGRRRFLVWSMGVRESGHDDHWMTRRKTFDKRQLLGLRSLCLENAFRYRSDVISP